MRRCTATARAGCHGRVTSRGDVALTKAERAARREVLLEKLRIAASAYRPRPVTLELQRGRKRPRVTGRIVYVATSGAFVLVADDGEPDTSIGEQPGPLHVPVDTIRNVYRKDPRC